MAWFPVMLEAGWKIDIQSLLLFAEGVSVDVRN
jgi:hypothetical protein